MNAHIFSIKLYAQDLRGEKNKKIQERKSVRSVRLHHPMFIDRTFNKWNDLFLIYGEAGRDDSVAGLMAKKTSWTMLRSYRPK